MNPYIHKVDFYETDRMGVVHHSNYIRWFETARIDALDQAGLTYAKMEEDGLFGVTLSVDCEYRRSARFGQTVEVEPVLTDVDDRFMTIHYVVRDADSKKERATGNTKHCFVGLDGKMLSLKETDPALYANIQALIGK